MADAYELFRRLSSGAKFNKSQYKQDLKKFKPSSCTVKLGSHGDLTNALDFFGNNLTQTGNEEHNHQEESICQETQTLSKKRKKEDVDVGEGSDNDEQINATRKSKTKKFSQEKLAALEREKINAFRNKNHIYIGGSDVPDPVANFEELQEKYNIPHYVVKNVQDSGYTEPTPIQMQAVPLMLHDREILACAPTGSGKTVAFILPLLHKLKFPQKLDFRAVIVSPTRELAQQIYREFCRMSRGRSFKIHVLSKASAKTNSFGPQSSQKHDILVTTPNRLVHLLSQEPPGIQLHNVEWLILDEADKLFEEGNDGFREQVATIYQACDNPKIHRGLFSATLSNGIEEWARLHLDNVVRVTIGLRNSATATVQQELLFVGQEAGKLLATRDIIQKGFTPPMLVFVQSKERAKELFHELIYDGINVDVIHSDRTQAQRDNIVKCFRTGKIWVLICTELMGRGIDFKGVNLVVNYDFPSSAVTYIHRIGRTGRAGRQGRAITFFTEDDAVNLRSIANVMRSSGCDVPDWMLKLKKPSRRKKKKLDHTTVERSSIKTLTKYDLDNAKKKRDMVEGSKRRKDKSKKEQEEEEKKTDS